MAVGSLSFHLSLSRLTPQATSYKRLIQHPGPPRPTGESHEFMHEITWRGVSFDPGFYYDIFPRLSVSAIKQFPSPSARFLALAECACK